MTASVSLVPLGLCFSLSLGSTPLSFQSGIVHMEENMAAHSSQVFLMQHPLTDSMLSLVPSTKAHRTAPMPPAWFKGHKQGPERPSSC